MKFADERSDAVDNRVRADAPGLGCVDRFYLGFLRVLRVHFPAGARNGILFGVGGLIVAANVGFWPIWIAAALGAVAGDWLAYDLAFRLKERVLVLWPFSSHPALVSHGLEFFKRWGLIAVFVGRFFGPFRAMVPIAAGLYAMPWLKFQIGNVASAALWAAGILTPGFLSVRWFMG